MKTLQDRVVIWNWMPEPEVVAQAIVRLALYPRRELFVPGYFAMSPWFEQQMPWLVDRFVAWFYRNHSL